MSMIINHAYNALDKGIKIGLDQADKVTNYRAHLYGDQAAQHTSTSRPNSLPAPENRRMYTKKDIKNLEIQKKEYIKGAAVMGFLAAGNTWVAVSEHGNQEILKGFNPMERPVRSAEFLSTSGYLIMAYKKHQEQKVALQNCID